MRRVMISVATLTLAALPQWAIAQDPIDLENLRAPSAPAFTVLGLAPTEVARPSSGRALGLWLLNSGAGTGNLPTNLALEVSPYWLRSRPATTVDSLFASDTRPLMATITSSLKQSLSLSLASAPSPVGADSAGPQVGFGARANLLPGRLSRGGDSLMKAFSGKLADCAEADDVQACYDRLDGDREALERAMTPVGVVIELAAATSLLSGTAPGDEPQPSRISAWLAPSYLTEDGFEFAALFRWTQDRSLAENPVAFDAGGRLTWRLSDEFALSAEGVARDPGTAASPYSNRWSALAEYRLPQGALLYYAVGRDFKEAATGIAPIFARFGISLGFGNAPIVTPTR